jgi:hypothetical protein
MVLCFKPVGTAVFSFQESEIASAFFETPPSIKFALWSKKEWVKIVISSDIVEYK